MSRRSLRLRLTLAFAAAMAVVLVATGVIVHRAFRADLNRTIDRSLGSRSDEVAALVGHTSLGLEPALRRVSDAGDDFAQLLAPSGALVASTPQVAGDPLLAGQTLRRATRGSAVVEHPPTSQLDGPLRLRAVPVDTPQGRLVVVVGTSLGERDDSLRTLAALLAGGGAVALLLASLAGYGVAAGALRPVEAMRRRAAAITPGEDGPKLPVSRSGDEIARLGATLNEMLDRLGAAFARERSFTADASHELRTPLGILRAEIELALRHGRSVEELRAALASAAEETDRLVQLAEDLLVIARLDQGRVPLRLAGLDAGELLAGVAGRFDVRAREAGRSIAVSAPPEARLHADRARVEQALGNLVDNALRHGDGPVRLTALAQGATVDLHVVDDGAGFPPGFVDRAFERFARADGARARGGAGLGLAIAAAIAASHGGRARAANRPVGGADVWIELPADPPGAQRSDTSSSRSSPPLTAAS